jgi:hypothetical protein
MSVRADAEALRGIPIFADCDPVHLQLLAFPQSASSSGPVKNLLFRDNQARLRFSSLTEKPISWSNGTEMRNP